MLSTLLFLKRSTNIQATFFLGSFYFILSVYLLQTYIVEGGNLYQVPWFFLWPLIPYNALCIPIYYYFQIILKDRLQWNWWQLLLFVPLLVAVIDVAYIYLHQDTNYAEIIQQATINPENRLNADYLVLNLNQHVLIRHLWQFGVLLVVLPQLKAFVKLGKYDSLKNILNKWLIVFWTVLFIMAVLVILYAIEKMLGVRLFYPWLKNDRQFGIVTVILYLVALFLEIVPLYFPSILHGYPQPVKNNSSTKPEVEKEEEESHLKYGLEEQVILEKLELLNQKKLYLDQNFTLTKCAQEMQMPAHHISYFLKNYYGQSFIVYKNDLRMEYAKNLIENGYLKNGTMEALASECAFASRTSFSKAFKNATGVSPSQYALDVT